MMTGLPDLRFDIGTATMLADGRVWCGQRWGRLERSRHH